MKNTDHDFPLGIVCFSFDDGRKDNRNAADTLLKYDLPATFNISTGYVDGTCPEELRPSASRALSVEDVKWIGCQPSFEIALHGNNHQNSVADIAEGRRKLIAWLNLDEDAEFGFASPGSGFDYGVIHQEPGASLFSKITYIRLGLRLKTRKRFRSLARKASRVIHDPLLYSFAYRETFLDREDRREFYAVPVMGDISFAQIRGLIRSCSRNNKAVVLMLHSIDAELGDQWSWSMKKFEKTCQLLYRLREQKQIRVLTVQSLYEQINEKR